MIPVQAHPQALCNRSQAPCGLRKRLLSGACRRDPGRDRRTHTVSAGWGPSIVSRNRCSQSRRSRVRHRCGC